MLNLVRGVVRMSVVAVTMLAVAGCGSGETVVVQPKSDKLDRIKGAGTPPPAVDAKAK